MCGRDTVPVQGGGGATFVCGEGLQRPPDPPLAMSAPSTPSTPSCPSPITLTIHALQPLPAGHVTALQARPDDNEAAIALPHLMGADVQPHLRGGEGGQERGKWEAEGR